MKKMLSMIAVLTLAFTIQAGTIGSIEIPADAKAVVVGGRNYWQVEDMLVENIENFHNPHYL